jgi:hypothetical protein
MSQCVENSLWESLWTCSNTDHRRMVIGEGVFITIYIFMSDTTIIKYTIVSDNKLKICGYMFRPHCSHLQANLHRSSAFNVRTLICVSWPENDCNTAETYSHEFLIY